MANGGARFGVDGRVCDPPTSAAVTRENVMTDGCGDASGSEWGLKGYPLAMVYAPLQNFVDIYEPEKGLCRGTIFAELDPSAHECRLQGRRYGAQWITQE